MRNKRRNREAFAEHSFWQSYSDMMAALLLIFILMIAITLAIYKQKTIDLDQTKLDYAAAQQELDNAQKELSDAQKELDIAKLDLESSRLEIEQSNQDLAASLAELQQAYDKAALTQQELNNAYLEIQSAQQELEVTKNELQDIVGIRTDIIGALQSTFHNSSMTVDAQTGSIMFSSDVLFRYNSANLTNESKETLQEVIPIYLDVLLQDQYRNYIAEIIIEGHTDTDGSYQSNMELSYKRANAVAKFCLDKKNGLSEEEIEQLQMLLTVNGRSYSDPIYKVDNADEIDMAASRRVEIKFRLKEDEMIEKIAAILEQE